jgi:hypothetical protein
MKLTSCCNDDDDVRLVIVEEVGVVVVITFDLPLEPDRGDGDGFLSLPKAGSPAVVEPKKSIATSRDNSRIRGLSPQTPGTHSSPSEAAVLRRKELDLVFLLRHQSRSYDLPLVRDRQT